MFSFQLVVFFLLLQIKKNLPFYRSAHAHDIAGGVRRVGNDRLTGAARASPQHSMHSIVASIASTVGTACLLDLSLSKSSEKLGYPNIMPYLTPTIVISACGSFSSARCRRVFLACFTGCFVLEFLGRGFRQPFAGYWDTARISDSTDLPACSSPPQAKWHGHALAPVCLIVGSLFSATVLFFSSFLKGQRALWAALGSL